MLIDIFRKYSESKKEKEENQRKIIKDALMFESKTYIERRNIFKPDSIRQLAKEHEFYEITLRVIDESDLLLSKEIDWLYYGFDLDEFIDYIMGLIVEKANKELI